MSTITRFDPQVWLDEDLYVLLNGPVQWILGQEDSEKALKACLREKIPENCPPEHHTALKRLRKILRMPIAGVFTFPCLKQSTCEAILEAVEAFERAGDRLERPNSMNKHGAILTSLSLDLRKSMQECSDYVLDPLMSLLFPLNTARSERHVHAFTVKYKVGEDVALSRHVDDSDATLNVSLGKVFAGGTLFFEGVERSALLRPKMSMEAMAKKSVLRHCPGVAVFHVGAHAYGTQGHVHGADPITKGERWNLILWRNPSFGDKLQLKTTV